MKPAGRKPAASAAKPPPDERRTILIVDDHPFMRAGVAQLLNRQPDLVVLAEAGDVVAAAREINARVPDLILTDITLPGRSGLEFIKDLQVSHPGLPVLVVSMHDEMIYAERALRAGARGYIMKEAGGENLLAAIRRIFAGEVYVSPRMSARLLDALSGRGQRRSHSPIEQLTDREFEVFQLVGAGKSTREIAQQMGISPKTADVHRSRIKEKLGLSNATELVRHAVRWVEAEGGRNP